MSGKYNIWKLNNIILNKIWIKQESKGNENKRHQNLWEVSKAVLREKKV